MPKLKLNQRQLIGIFIILLVAIFGVKYLISSHALSPYASTEAESGTINGPATINTDSSASNGHDVQFGVNIPMPISTCNSNPVSGSEPASFLSQPPTLGAVTNPSINPCLRTIFTRPKNVIAVNNNLWVDDDNGLTELQQNNGQDVGNSCSVTLISHSCTYKVATEPFGLTYGNDSSGTPYLFLASGQDNFYNPPGGSNSGSDVIMKINPSNPAAAYSTYSTSPSNPDWVTYADGDLWIPINSTIIEVDPTTLQTIRTIPIASDAKGITYFDGYIWAASSNGSNGGNLYRINPSDGTISATINGAPSSPVYIASCSMGVNSTLWITGAEKAGSPYAVTEIGNLTASAPTVLQQINTGTSFQSAYGASENNNTYGAACGYGYVWIGSDYVTQLTSGNIGFGDGNLRVYDEYTGKFVKSDQLNGKQIAVTLSNGMVWVDDVNADSILGYTPNSLL